VRYWPLPPGHQQGLNVMAVALPIRQALEWHELFARDRLRLRRIDVAPCALVHLALRIWTPAENELWGVLDLGLRRATLTVVLGARPAYIRSLAASSEQWTRRLARGFEVDRAKAEQIKRAHGIQPVERAARGPQPSSALRAADSIPSIVFRLLCEPLDDLIREVNLCFAYVMQNFPDVNVSRLLLAGGGANLTGLAQYLELHLGVPVALLQSPASTGGSAEIPPTRWERPLPQAALNPEESAAVGGAILDLESA
jgi:Tfp pilus assembly PilM family ATPase